MAVGTNNVDNPIVALEQRHNDKHVDHETRISKIEATLEKVATKEDILKLQLDMSEKKDLSWRFYLQILLTMVASFASVAGAVAAVLTYLNK